MTVGVTETGPLLSDADTLPPPEGVEPPPGPTCDHAGETANAEAALRASLPPAAAIVRFASRRKGRGGLGRPRYVAIAAWQGGQLVREAKALVASAVEKPPYWRTVQGRFAYMVPRGPRR